MTPGEFREFAKAMREFGIQKAKLGDTELELFHVEQSPPSVPAQVPIFQKQAISAQLETPPLVGGMPADDKDPIQHRIEQVVSLMKLGDNELVDAMFPEKIELPPDEVAS
jgi:hypothetical protein